MENRYRSVIAYLLGIIGPLIVLFGLKDNTKQTKVHASQALTIQIISAIVGVVNSILSNIPVIKYLSFVIAIIPVLLFALQIAGAIKAYHEEDFDIPLVSDWAKNIFKKQIEEEETK